MPTKQLNTTQQKINLTPRIQNRRSNSHMHIKHNKTISHLRETTKNSKFTHTHKLTSHMTIHSCTAKVPHRHRIRTYRHTDTQTVNIEEHTKIRQISQPRTNS